MEKFNKISLLFLFSVFVSFLIVALAFELLYPKVSLPLKYVYLGIINSIITFCGFYFYSKFTNNEKVDKISNSTKNIFDATLNASNEGIIVLDNRNKIISSNERLRELFNISETVNFENSYFGFLQVIKDNLLHKEKVTKRMEHVLLHRDIKSHDCILLKDGTFLEFNSNPILINAKVKGVVLSFRDITNQTIVEEEMNRHVEELHETKDMMERNAFELVELNLKLEESEKELEELNANKDKFFSIVAHDLKSPFTGLIGFTEMMIEDFDTLTSSELKEYIHSLHKTAKSTLNLLKNLLNWSRLKSGKMEFTPENFDLFEVIEEVLSLAERNAKNKGINVYSEIKKETLVFADRNMIDTVLRNLLANAIKFTHSGGSVSIFTNENDDSYEVTISDTGIGMNEIELSKIFRIDETHTTLGTNNETGTGLGLILCSELIEKNGGVIRCNSEKQIGTSFVFTLAKAITKNKILAEKKIIKSIKNNVWE